MSEQQTVVLADNLSTDTLTNLGELLEGQVATPDSVTVDATDVESVDFLSFQLLVAFDSTRRQNGLSTDWLVSGNTLQQAAELLAVGQEMNVTEKEAAADEEEDNLCPVF